MWGSAWAIELHTVRRPPSRQSEAAVLWVSASPRLISVVLTSPQRAADLVLERHQTEVLEALWARFPGMAEETGKRVPTFRYIHPFTMCSATYSVDCYIKVIHMCLNEQSTHARSVPHHQSMAASMLPAKLVPSSVAAAKHFVWMQAK